MTWTTSPTGAITNYVYFDNLAQPYSTATTNNKFVTTVVDGFGRTISVRAGYNNPSAVAVSVVDTNYGPFGCSPLGKVTQVSQPYAPGATPVWTVYAYDGLGRTLTVTAPDGSSHTQYSYLANTVTVTDAAGKWKKFTTDVFGNLTQVNEPKPGGGADYVTTYSYDSLNHLTQVGMTRPVGTQTRTFAYDAGGHLVSATNPENGTSTWNYLADGRLYSKFDAKG